MSLLWLNSLKSLLSASWDLESTKLSKFESLFYLTFSHSVSLDRNVRLLYIGFYLSYNIPAKLLYVHKNHAIQLTQTR